jgi:hypothetical protein
MSENDTPPPAEVTRPPRAQRDFFGRRLDAKPRWERRKDKIRAEIERNRRGDYKVPTWVLAAILVAIVVGFAILLIVA